MYQLILIASCDNVMNDMLNELNKVRLVPVNGVSIDKNSTILPRGYTERLTASVEPDNAADTGISWESSNTDAATVDADGVVTAVEGGTATITVTTADGGFTAECNVEVITPPTTQADKLLADDGE